MNNFIKIGDLVSVYFPHDRQSFTVISVSKKGKTAKIKRNKVELKPKIAKKLGLVDQQPWVVVGLDDFELTIKYRPKILHSEFLCEWFCDGFPVKKCSKNETGEFYNYKIKHNN